MIGYPKRQDGAILSTRDYPLDLDSGSVHKHAAKKTSIAQMYLNTFNVKPVIDLI